MNTRALKQFRISLEDRKIPLNLFKRDFTTFKKLCYLVLTEQITVKQATTKATEMALKLSGKR